MDCTMLLLKALTALSTRKTGIWDTALDEFQQFHIYCILPHVALCLTLGCYELVGFLTSRGSLASTRDKRLLVHKIYSETETNWTLKSTRKHALGNMGRDAINVIWEIWESFLEEVLGGP